MTPAERHQLIDTVLEGDVSDADFLRLEAELAVDPVARRDYYDRVLLSLLLEAEAVGTPEARPQRIVTRDDLQGSRRRWRRAFVGMATAAAALLAVLAWEWKSPFDVRLADDQADHSSELAQGSVETLAAGFGVVTGQADAVWADRSSLSNGSLIPPGDWHLLSGVVELELFSGVTLVVEGESRFSIHSPMEVAVAAGKVRARVPEPAHGFRVVTDAGHIVDLGTEFAVNVTADGSEVHVLDGQIEWQARGAQSQRMEQGEAARITNRGDALSLRADPEDFVGARELRQRLQRRQVSRLELWRGHREELKNDPRLVVYYRARPEDLSTRRLPNLVAGGEAIGSEGAVVAAASTSNRWGQPETALDFSPAGSRVRLSVPGEYRSLTLVCWVRINSLDRWYNSLFLTDGHEAGEPHWQIMDDGRLFFSVKKRDLFDLSRGERDKHVYFSPAFWSSELSGQWLMIATVYDVDARVVRHFLNGEILSQEAIPEEYLVESIRIGNASLGNWGMPERAEPRFAVRNLNGSLDEFALFKAALPAEEIRRLYDDGQP